MTALVHSIGTRTDRTSALLWDIALVVLGTGFVSLMAQVAVPLEPFSPVPITGQTLAVLVVGGALGALRGGASLLLYLLLGWAGAPVYAEGTSGSIFSLPSGGYIVGFVIAAVVVGALSEQGWDRSVRSSLGAMLIGEIIIFAVGVPWLANEIGAPASKALELGLYPFVIGDLIKLLIAAGLLPAAWSFVRDKTAPPSFKR